MGIEPIANNHTIVYMNGNAYFWSYTTLVAYLNIATRELIVCPSISISATTKRHFNAFKKRIEGRYTDTVEITNEKMRNIGDTL